MIADWFRRRVPLLCHGELASRNHGKAERREILGADDGERR